MLWLVYEAVTEGTQVPTHLLHDHVSAQTTLEFFALFLSQHSYSSANCVLPFSTAGIACFIEGWAPYFELP